MKMKCPIAVIVSIKSVAQTARRIIAEKNVSIPVYHCYFEKAVQVGHWLVKQGVQAVVSLGVTAEMLQNQTSLAVFEIQYTGLECLDAVKKAYEISDRIAVLGSHIIRYHMATISKQLNQDIPCYKLRTDISAQKQVQELVDLGYGAVISGTPGGEIARQCGIGGITLEIDERMIRIAIDNALLTLKLRNESTEKSETIHAILDSTSEGILCTNKDGNITYVNRAAQHLMGSSNSELMGQPLDTILNQSQTVDLFADDSKVSHDTQNILLSSRPIQVQGDIVGSVYAVNQVSRIQNLERRIRRELLSKGHFAKNTLDDIIGKSPAIIETKKIAQKYAQYDSRILISGESGTGKEMFAQGIHNSSRRANEAFIAVNCAALPEHLLESELFGYVRGAFTGAHNQGKIGYFETAHKGTIFLDEVGEIPLSMQAKLLRVLQENEITRIGDDRVISVDIRVICATNKDLFKMVQQGEFREDLYYRLCVLDLRIPPLRERKEDIELLVYSLIQQKNKTLGTSVRSVTPELMQKLTALNWEGNVRQLSNTIERMIVLSDGLTLDRPLFGAEDITDNYNIAANLPATASLQDTENERILEVLKMTNGNKKEAAAILGIGTTTLWRKLKEINGMK